jgi:hypothetical protein
VTTTPRSGASRLLEALERENAALAALDLAAASVYLEPKRLALEDLIRQGGATALDPTTLARLDAEARRNQTLLRQALAVQARVIEIVAGAPHGEPPAPRYTAAGSWASASRATPRALLARV